MSDRLQVGGWTTIMTIGQEAQHNYGRHVAAESLRDTLEQYYRKDGISELRLRDAWLERLRNDSRLYRTGWYVPPPAGIAVLTGSAQDPSRIAFSSLREPQFWPSDRIIDWDDGLLYAYASPVDRTTGLPGDFAVTLYFGQDPAWLDHFRTCREATKRIIDSAPSCKTSMELYHYADRILLQYRLRNAIVGYYDPHRTDIGHSLPVITSAIHPTPLDQSPHLQETFRSARRFICPTDDWPLQEVAQLTIEPQLVSIENPSAPQVSMHYVVVCAANWTVLDEGDTLTHAYMVSS